MVIHASPTRLPELEEFLSTFKVRFRRPEGEAALERYLTGLLTELPNKNCDTMAEAVPGTSEQCLQEFLTNMQWDEQDLNRQRVEKLIAEAAVGNGVLIFDDTGFAKQGKASVGVARQYSGTLGKVGNCQVAVTCCYDDPQASWPVAVRLYLPEAWTDAPERLQRARVPSGPSAAVGRAASRRGDGRRLWRQPEFLVGFGGAKRALRGGHPVRLSGASEVSWRAPIPTGRPGVGGGCEVSVAHHPLAARDQGMVAQAVCGHPGLAHYG